MIKILYSTLTALTFLHELNIMHRDLKSANMSSYHYVMSNVLQSKPNEQIGRVANNKYFISAFNSANLAKMNKNLADSVVSYFCDGLGSLRSTWKAQIGK